MFLPNILDKDITPTFMVATTAFLCIQYYKHDYYKHLKLAGTTLSSTFSNILGKDTTYTFKVATTTPLCIE